MFIEPHLIGKVKKIKLIVSDFDGVLTNGSIYLDKDGIMTELEIDNVRDRKSSGKQWKIPCQYNDETKEVQMIEEIDAQEREINRKIFVQKDIEDQRPEFKENNIIQLSTTEKEFKKFQSQDKRLNQV